MNSSNRSYAVLAKPVGSLCNLNCHYCFYKEKANVFKRPEKHLMSDEVLESYIKQYIEMHGDNEIQFPWQGGEPVLAGRDFFEKAVSFQRRYGEGRRITNTFQTNGVLLDEKWCDFFAENDFLIGISIDGPEELHDAYRKDKQSGPTFKRVINSINLLKNHGVQYNTLTAINNINSSFPIEVYQFLKEIGDGFMQFIPLVERMPDSDEVSAGYYWSAPGYLSKETSDKELAPFSVTPEAFAGFYTGIFDEWVRKDVGAQFIQFFDACLGNFLGMEPGVCYHSKYCGHAAALEYNGDVFSCDHFVYPSMKLGNILKTPLYDLLNSATQKEFGESKYSRLPGSCMECEYLFLCYGECPKNRFLKRGNEDGLNYLCSGYKKIFSHMIPYLDAMAELIKSGDTAGTIMELIE
jgi:uncharacterized protein